MRDLSIRILLLLCLLLPGFDALAEGLPMMAVILPKGIERYATAHAAFERTWRQCPLAPKTDLYLQRPAPEKLSLTNSIRKAVGFDAKLIVVYGDRAALAVKQELPSMPVAFAEVYAPQELGLPGVGETRAGRSGISNFTPARTMLRNFRGIFQGTRLGIVYDPDDLTGLWQYQLVADLLPELGMSGIEIPLPIDSLPGSHLFAAESSVDAIFVTDSYALSNNQRQLSHLANAANVPIISQIPGHADAGALIDMAASPEEQGEKLAGIACRILSGKGAEAMPVLSPSKVELVINMQQAKRFELRIPFQVLGMATRVVQGKGTGSE